MGFVSMSEDITERYYGASPFFAGWQHYYARGGRATAGDQSPPAPLVDRPRRIIRDLRRYFSTRAEELNRTPSGYWEQHHANLDGLSEILRAVTDLPTEDGEAWAALTHVEARLRHFFKANPVYGPLSPNVLSRVLETSRAIRSRCGAVERELDDFLAGAHPPPDDDSGEDVRAAVREFGEIRERLEAEQSELKRYFGRAEQVRHWGELFLREYARQAVQARNRAALQHLHRLRLNAQQERLVALDHDGAFRVQGASGSGKTIILIHRALRLAQENPLAQVRVFTVNRSLAELLRAYVEQLEGRVPWNLHVAAFYDFLGTVQRARGINDNRGLVDPLSGERIAASWREFYSHRGVRGQQNVFARASVRELVESLAGRAAGIDPCAYLRDEVVYIQSAYRIVDRKQYLTEPRTGRGVPLVREYREACLTVLAAWEDWLRDGDLCDVDRLTLRAGMLFETEDQLQRVRAAVPTHHVLVDEVQDFSTQELRLLRRLVADPDGPNRFFLVGDLNQKVFAKQHVPKRAGFELTGRSRTLARNYRNTRQILAAAYRLVEEYPALADEPIQVAVPELSQYEGGRPVAFACRPVTHPTEVMDIVSHCAGRRVAVVSENNDFLARVRAEAGRRGVRCYQLYRVEDLDLWREQEGGSLRTGLVVSRLEAVKGFEFDVVVACDLSDGVVPRPGTPDEEHWREAATLYAALTRARDQLVVTYVGRRSPFLSAMTGHIDFLDGSVTERLRSALVAP